MPKTLSLIFFILAGAIPLLWLAFFNHYPIIYPDSFAYIDGASAHFRSLGYYIFITSTTCFNHSLWMVIIFQSLIVSYLLIRVPCLLYKSTPHIELIAFVNLLILTLFSEISQYVSWLMPDIFTGCLFLICLLLFLNPSPKESLVLMGLLIFCLPMHNSNIIIGFVLVSILIPVILFHRQSKPDIVKACLKITASVLAGFIIICGINLKMEHSHHFQLLSPSGSRFVVAKLAANKILVKTLREYCPEKDWNICKIQSQLESSTESDPFFFLWEKESPFKKDYLLDNQKETNEIALCSLRNYPFEILKSDFKDFLAMIHKYDWVKAPYFPAIIHYRSPFKRRPNDIQSYFHTRQYKKLPLPSKPLPISNLTTEIICLLYALFMTLRYFHRKNYYPAYILLGCLLFILVNDFITASISGSYPRYHLRILWLLPFILLTLSIEFVRNLVGIKRLQFFHR